VMMVTLIRVFHVFSAVSCEEKKSILKLTSIIYQSVYTSIQDEMHILFLHHHM